MERSDAFSHYIDYLIASKGQATATGLSELLDNGMKHDYISDCLSQEGLDQKAFWKAVKPLVRKVEAEDSVLSIDDVIIPKPHTNGNDVVCYHFDHTSGRSVKGINKLNFLLSGEHGGQTVNCPIAYRIVRKDVPYVDKSGKTKYKSALTKNEMAIEELHRAVSLNKVKFRYVLFDIWFGSSATLKYIHGTLEKKFVCPLKSNRLLALSADAKERGEFVAVSQVGFGSGGPLVAYVKGLDFPVLLIRQVFTNKDRSTAEQYLITNDMGLGSARIAAIYKKRWKVEEMHKSLKQNALLGRSPTKTETSQCNHIFAVMLAYVRLEWLKIKERMNHFALKAKLYMKMLRAAFDELQVLKGDADPCSII